MSGLHHYLNLLPVVFISLQGMFMIAETIPAAYDGAGRQVSSSFFRREAPHAALPMGRYISHPLTVNCKSIRDIRQFLANCQMISAQDLFGKDYWQPPEELERLKKGGCVDVSLWTWRQLLSLGYEARFVGGSSGRYGDGHAWVEYFRDGKCFLVEPQYCRVGDTMPRLTTLRYKPKLSVGGDGTTLKYFVHKATDFRPSWRLLVPLFGEWLAFWSRLWLRVTPRLPLLLGRKLWKAVRS